MPQFLNQSKTDFAFKYGLGIFHTNNSWNWFAELFKNEVNVLASRIWADSIPFAGNATDADTAASGYAQVTKRTIALTLQPSHNNRLWRAREIAGDANSTLILDSISPLDAPDASGAPSIGYTVRLFQDDGAGNPGSEISTTSGAWAWHYKLCALLLDEGHTATDEGWTTPLHAQIYQYTGNFGVGGGSGVTYERVELGLPSKNVRNRWLHAAGIPTNLGGSPVISASTIKDIVVSVQSLGDCTVSIYKQGTSTAIATVALSNEKYKKSSVSVLVNAGDLLQAFVDSASGVDYPILVIGMER